MLRLGAVARGIADEVRAMHAVALSVPLGTWVTFAVLYLALATVGLLPLGHVALALHVLAWVVLALVLIAPGVDARLWRADDDLGIRGRHDPTVVGHLPDVIALFAFPFYMLSQAVLFWRLERQFPGSLAGDGWGTAWGYALDNLLLTELFLDVFDVFRLTLASDATSLLGAVAVFTTRAALSLGFIRVALRILRAAVYRASGVGRGVDHLASVLAAVEDGDVPAAHYHATAIASGMHATVELLADRVDDPVRGDDAWRSLHAIRDWAIPHLLLEAGHGHARAARYLALAETLGEEGFTPPARADPVARPLVSGALAVAGVAVLALPLLIVGPWGAVVAIALTVAAGWALTSPRSLLEAAVERGLVAPFPVARFQRATVAWVAATTVVFLVAGFGLVVNVAAVAPGAFDVRAGGAATTAVLPPVDVRSASGFVLANLARVQVLFGAADVFAFAPLPLEQRPVAGSLVTFALRTGINLGLVALVLTLLTVGGERLGLGALGVNHVLLAALEARRGGRYASDLLVAHDLAVGRGLLAAIDQAERDDLRMALASSGAYAWCAHHPTAGASEALVELEDASRARSQAAIVEALGQRGWGRGIAPLVDEVDALFEPHEGESLAQVVPWLAVDVWCHLAALTAGTSGREREAWRTLQRADAVLRARGVPEALLETYGPDETNLAEDRPPPEVVARAWREAERTWVRVAASLAIDAAGRDDEVPSRTILRDARARLAAASDPQRLAGAALLLDLYAAAWEEPDTVVATLTRVQAAHDDLPATHPERRAIGAAARLLADVAEERGAGVADDLRSRLDAADATSPEVDAFDPRRFDALVRMAGLLVRVAPGAAALAGCRRALASAETHDALLAPPQRSALLQTLVDATFAASRLDLHTETVVLGRALRVRSEAAMRVRGGSELYHHGVLASAEAVAAAALDDANGARDAAEAARSALTAVADAATDHSAIDRADLATQLEAIETLLRRLGGDDAPARS